MEPRPHYVKESLQVVLIHTQVENQGGEPLSFKGDPKTSSIGFTWEFVTYAASQSSPQTHSLERV